jgi:hypothetical protein
MGVDDLHDKSAAKICMTSIRLTFIRKKFSNWGLGNISEYTEKMIEKLLMKKNHIS